MMTDNDCKKIATFICEAMKEDKELQDVMAKAIGRVTKPKRRLVKLSEAASILGISESQLYHIKNDSEGRRRFSYIKQGKAKSSPLLFDESRLIEEFERYLLEKQ